MCSRKVVVRKSLIYRDMHVNAQPVLYIQANILSSLIALLEVNLYVGRLSNSHELCSRHWSLILQHVLLTAHCNDLALRLRARRKVRLLPAKCRSANSKVSSRSMARFLCTEEAGLPAELLGYGLVQWAQSRQRSSSDGEAHLYLRPNCDRYGGEQEFRVSEGWDIGQTNEDCRACSVAVFSDRALGESCLLTCKPC